MSGLARKLAFELNSGSEIRCISENIENFRTRKILAVWIIILNTKLTHICVPNSVLVWSDVVLLSTFTDTIFVDLDLIGKGIDLNPAARLSLG